MRRSGWIRCGWVVAAAVVAGLIVYFLIVGLDKADKLASVLSLFVAVLALAVPYLLDKSRSSAASAVLGAASGSQQSVADTVVGGNLTQAIRVGGERLTDTVTPAATPETAPTAGREPISSRGQYVNGAWVAGNLTQISGADDGVTAE